MSAALSFAQVLHRGQTLHIEHAWVGGHADDAPLIVFLHEGLGSLAMWKDFPKALCDAVGCRALVYSRPGYGQSTPGKSGEVWGPDFMHVQAHELLPALLDSLGITQPVWLFGHSDGASIALLFAAAHPERTAGLVVMAPHIMVEPISEQSIAKTLALYERGQLKAGLAKYHAEPDSAFYGWYGAWMNPEFANWHLDAATLQAICCPVLAIQGEGDEYGTFAQIDGIAACAPQTQLLKLPQCGHSPHRDQPDAVIRAVQRLVRHVA